MSAGAQVVLADIGEPRPGSATASSTNSSTTGGDFPGGCRNGGPQVQINGRG